MNSSLKGEIVGLSVINERGEEVRSYSGAKNLLMNQGMDAIARLPIADLFAVAVRGTGTQITTETVDVANSFSRSGAVVTRTAGTRNFTSDDAHKFLLFTGSGVTANQGGVIISIDSTIQVTLDNSGISQTSKDIIIYDIGQVEMDQEFGLSAVDPAEQHATAGSATVTTTDPYFTASMVGLGLYFPTPNGIIPSVYRRILTVNSSTSVTIDEVMPATFGGDFYLYTPRSITDPGSASRTRFYGVRASENLTTDLVATRTLKRTFVFAPDPQVEEEITGTYSRALAVVTRVSGARDFTSGDVGKIIHFETANVECKITVFTNATTVTVDTSGTLAAQSIDLFGWNTYTEIGFSNLDEFDDGTTAFPPARNIHIRVLLGTPVIVYGKTPLVAGEQLKVTYQFTITVSPSVETVGTLNGIITDAGNAMSTKGKAGKFAIESLALSAVSFNGDTDVSFAFLEPFIDGFLGIAENAETLVPLSGHQRTGAVQYTAFTADAYAAGDYAKTYQATFGMTEAVGTKWRSLMLYDADTGAIYTFLFDNPQNKSADRLLSMIFQKTWSRDFS